MTSVPEDSYEDSLDIRRNDWFGDSLFYLCFNNYYNSSNKTLPEVSKETRQWVFQSPRVSHAIHQLSKEEGIPEEKLWLKVDSLLSVIAHDFYFPLLKPASYFCCVIARRIFGTLQVNSEGLTKVLELMNHHPVLLMATHRSYFDFVLMPMTFMQHGRCPPAVVAGDNLSRGFLGSIIHSCGGIFIRRSIGNDYLYKALLSEYIHKCIIGAQVPLEVFVEGARSRTSLPLKPKKGILSMALEPYFFGLVPDIAVVPISVSYDRTVEERLYAREELGAKKEAESATTLVSAFSQLMQTPEKCGNACVHYSEPIMMSSWCKLEGDELRHKHSLGPEHIHKLSEKERDIVEDLGWKIVEQQHKHMNLSPFGVAALAIGKSSAPISMKDLLIHYQKLKEALQLVGARFLPCEDHKPDAELVKALRLHSSVVSISSDGMAVHLAPADTQKLRGKHLKSSTLEAAMVHLLLQHERNMSLSYLVRSAVLVLTLQHQKEEGSNFHEDLNFLLDILSEDFVQLKRSTKSLEQDALEEGLLLGVIHSTPEGFISGNDVLLMQLLSGQLEPFLTAYAALAAVLKRNSEAMAEEEVVEMAQVEVERLLDKGDTRHFSSLSLSVLKHGLEALVRLGAATRLVHESQKSSLLVTCAEKAASLKTRILSFIASSMGNFSRTCGKL